jgi:hypothetical protein
LGDVGKLRINNVNAGGRVNGGGNAGGTFAAVLLVPDAGLNGGITGGDDNDDGTDDANIDEFDANNDDDAAISLFVDGGVVDGDDDGNEPGVTMASTESGGVPLMMLW